MKFPATASWTRAEKLSFGLITVLLLVVLPLLNALPTGSFLHLSDFYLNLFGKFLAYAILALGIDLIWGYTGILSLGQGVFFGLGAYVMGMHLMLAIGKRGVYQSTLPDFMVWNQVKELPLFWKPFYSFGFTMAAIFLVPALFALVFGFLAFRSRIRGVYFAIITQALALVMWLLFNRNELNLGGTNGLTDFKVLLGFDLLSPSTQRGLYITTALCLMGSYLLCRWITKSRLGKVLTATRDNEHRVRFSGYSPANYKLFVFVVSAALAGLAGALYVPQVGIITPSQIGVFPSIEMVVWVAVGGRGILIGAVVGAIGVNWARSFLTTAYPDLWLIFLGALFIGVVLFIPDGIIGYLRNLLLRRRAASASADEEAPLGPEGRQHA
ncbi:urea ABC transporter permease subunit UrtC [Nitrospinae bacterium AH_259_B05_G02_I21]|nr:urea ABC transporter permease subunit UrtC [Nitrospinae bacterium AH_259_B05_G02_I21]